MSNITTKNGDGGMTGLVNKKNVPKSDERIHLLGDLDELTSYIGLARTKMTDANIAVFLERIQNDLMVVMAGVADPHTVKHRLSESQLQSLEKEMERLTGMFRLPEPMVLSGKNTQAAELDVIRTVARRAERSLSTVTIKFGTDKTAKKYINRLSDYFYILARYVEQFDLKEAASTPVSTTVAESNIGRPEKQEAADLNKAIVSEVLRQIGEMNMLPAKLNLQRAKELIEKVEAFAKDQGLNAVLAVCGADGNPIAVHVMDNAFLVSFDVAVKKAYTAASVKMSTMELADLVRPGGTFQGLDKLQGDKMVFFGGGVPLMKDGVLLGALGVSGGTGEQDDTVARYGVQVFREMM